jgi:isocitrate/isopropylmalate dehydrogenase
MSHKVTLIPGDGIGPEVSAAARRAVDATGVKIDWEVAELNAEIIMKTGVSLPPHVIESLEQTHVGLKGPVTTPVAAAIQRQRGASAKSWICSRTCGRCVPCLEWLRAFKTTRSTW